MTRETVKELIPTLPPWAAVAVNKLAGLTQLTLDRWVLIATLVYTVIQILRSCPKLLGCVRCFWTYKACTLVCKK
jgi:hypothetical protein